MGTMAQFIIPSVSLRIHKVNSNIHRIVIPKCTPSVDFSFTFVLFINIPTSAELIGKVIVSVSSKCMRISRRISSLEIITAWFLECVVNRREEDLVPIH